MLDRESLKTVLAIDRRSFADLTPRKTRMHYERFAHERFQFKTVAVLFSTSQTKQKSLTSARNQTESTLKPQADEDCERQAR
jgi:hypothetical protein